jgi:hypothetical protein
MLMIAYVLYNLCCQFPTALFKGAGEHCGRLIYEVNRNKLHVVIIIPCNLKSQTIPWFS